MVSDVNKEVWSALESCLVPPSATQWYYPTILKKCIGTVILLPTGIVTGVFTGVEKAGSFALSFFRSPAALNPKENFQLVVKNFSLWKQIGTDQQIEDELVDNPSGLKEPAIESVGTSTFQDSPYEIPDSQWAADAWQLKIPKADRPGPNVNLFKLYKTPEGRQELIRRLEKLHVTNYRFSVEWSHIEPKQGNWNDSNMKVYIDLCEDLRAAGIAPIVVLLHFSEPKWFHALGSFENEDNIKCFANFSFKVFDQLTESYQGRPLVETFITINEPAVDAFSRYVLGTFSPGKFLNFAKAGLFLKNLLKAHIVVYDRLKEKELPTVKVGIVHQYLKMRPKYTVIIPATRYLTRLVNEVPMNFFKSGGKFDFKVPFLCNIEEQCKAPKTDFVGLQYYVRPIIGFGPSSYGEPMTEMPFHEDPAGVYKAILKTYEAFNKVPILVSEIGISTRNDQQRSRYMLRARYAIREATKVLGKDLLGVSWWCLGDNMELNMGMKQPFGLYAQTENGLATEPKKGVEASIRVAKAWKDRRNKKTD
ncbi:MAG TPA: family 1 glycosylhydrolase [Rhabdochlamydiaceae bacterium]|nr:family 1 glycosylhydrolase [Rhabdochlamydiaceae bacterium]